MENRQLYKDPLDERNRAARRKHYYANKEQYYARNVKKKAELREYVNNLKAVPCMDCGQSYPHYIMDFDHRDASEKVLEISRLIKHLSLRRIQEEVPKCDVVCSNCHRERTYQRTQPKLF